MANDAKPAREYPTLFQRKTIWSGLSAFFVVVLFAIGVGAIYLTSVILGYLQPLLVPLAAAAIIAYLLEPVILTLIKKGVKRDRAVLAVFVGFMLSIVLLAVLVIRPAIQEARDFAKEENIEKLRSRATNSFTETRKFLDTKFETLPFYVKAEEWIEEGKASEWFVKNSKDLTSRVWAYLGGGFVKVVGVFGYVIGVFLVPVYLYYFLRESTNIAANWTKYLPLRRSHFKDEVVGTLTDINGYLIAFFRGQMLVSMIDGALIGIVLMILGLPYALLIGVFVAILGLIPYIGNLLCLIPAVVISIAHFGAKETKTLANGETTEVLVNAWGWLPQAWAYPLIVIGIFFVVQQINGLVTAPKIVGDSVGLHPLTVIFSVLFWSLLLGGLLGALLAVPLTAAVKVLFMRYVWERRVKPGAIERFTPSDVPPDEPAAAT